jgi:hypothetical protein
MSAAPCHFATGFLLAISLCLSAISVPAADGDVQFTGSHRLRYESLHHGPLKDAAASDEILVSRLLARLEYRNDRWTSGIELQDSRAWLHGPATPLGTDDVNALEPLQAWVGYRGGEEFPLDVTVGRMTKQWHTRRLVARNRYRNTLNGFQGIDAVWHGDGWQLNGFLLEPLDRRPLLRRELEENKQALDQRRPAQSFWGIEYQPNTSRAGALYLLGLKETDHEGTPSSDRDLVTLGGHWQGAITGTPWRHAGELAVQFGTSRASRNPLDQKDLDHRAWFGHIELSRSLGDEGRHRVRFAMDYASGDRNRNDGKNQVFDTLYGARRFEYGPSGIYAVWARSNVLSPEVRFTSRPLAKTEWLLAWRGLWLAQPDSDLAGTRYQPPEGNRRRHVGQQLETRLRYDVSPNLRLELGAAWLAKGSLISSDDFTQGDHPATYLYWATTLRW